MQRISTPRICGTLVVLTAALLLLGRAPGMAGLYSLLPGGERMGYLSMLMMACAGYAIAVLDLPWRHLTAARRASVLACLLVLLLLPLGFLIEAIFDVALGIDLAAPGARPSAATPHPGRTSPNGALAMLLTGLALASLVLPRRRSSVGMLATVAVATIALAALIGHALGLQDLYRLAGYNRLLPLTAAVLCLCAVGLWSLTAPVATPAHRAEHAESSINRRSAGLFAFVAVIGGVAGFAVLRSSFEEATASNLLLTTRTTAASIANEIEANLWYPKVIVARTSVRTAMARLSAQRSATADGATEALAQLAERYFDDQVTGAQFLTANGNVLFSSGILSIRDATVKHVLHGSAGGAILFWADGYVLETRNDIVHNGRMVGVLVVETRLPRIHEVLGDVQESGSTTDTALCGVVAPGDPEHVSFACGPTRFHRNGLARLMRADRGSVAGSLALALGGASGTGFVRDGSGESDIIHAYTPVGKLGLALGVNAAVESLYAPLRGPVLQLSLVLAVVVAAGTLILRRLVRPLVMALAREQRRTARILENCNDAFVALDAQGRITDWNTQAVRLFGWSAREAHGRLLASLILAPANHAELAAALAASDHAHAGSHRIELRASHRDGRPLPVELSLKSELTADGYLAHVFIEDISARQAAREALRQSEQRLSLIANNLPALVSYIDRDFRYRFTNKNYQRWFQLPADALAGKTVSEVFGPAVFENVRERIETALAGVEVAFELDNAIAGAPAKMHVHYIPDRDHHGRVVGVFGMVLDNTAQHQLQMRLEASERQLRTLAGAAPA